MEQYKSKSGAMLWRPSVEECEDADENMEGFCLACGDTVPGIEPDARRYTCEACGQDKVYGACELALMGIVH